MNYATKIERDIRERLNKGWPAFQERRTRILSQLADGILLHEKDIENVFQALAEGPLGYEIEQLSTQRNYADYALIDRGLKLAIVEFNPFNCSRAA